ncbi:MAG: non-ribosomal peptide synthetase [Dermatophilaceae bacterium]
MTNSSVDRRGPSTATGAGSGSAVALTDLQVAYLLGRRPGPALGGIRACTGVEILVHDVDDRALAASYAAVTGRYDVVGTSVVAEEAQLLTPPSPLRLDLVDLSGAEPAAREAALTRARAALEEAPDAAMRASAYRVGDAVHVFVVIDLVLLDLPGLQQVLDAWAAELRRPTRSPDPGALGGLGDQLRAVEADTSGPAGERARRRWEDELDTLPPAPELPLATAPESLAGPAARHLTSRISADVWTQLHATARANGIDPETLPLLALTEVVRTWSKEPDFRLAVSSRHRPPPADSPPAAGQLTVPGIVSVRAASTSTLRERAEALQEQARRAADLNAYSGIQVMRDLTRRHGGTRATAPVVHTSTLGTGVPDGIGALGELVTLSTRTPQVWLEHQVVATGGGLTIGWHTVDGLLRPGVLEAMVSAHDELLRRMATDPAVWDTAGRVVDLPADAATEQAAVNDTASDIPPARLHDLVANAARRHPNAPAVIHGDTVTTHGTLHDRALRLAGRIQAVAAPQPGELVAVMLGAGTDQLVAVLAVLHAGGAYVVVDPALPAIRRRALIERCQVSVVVSRAQDAADTVPDGVTVVPPTASPDLPTDVSAGPPTDVPGAEDGGPRTPDDLAYVIFTSGSTGEPKGVAITHRSAANTVQDIVRRFDVTERDRVLALAPSTFDLSVFDIFGVLGAGGAVVIPDADRAGDPDHWVDLVSDHDVTLWNTVPAPMRLYADALARRAADGPVTGPRLVLLSGDWIPLDLPDRVRDVLPDAEVVSLGGATEGSIWSICHRIRDVDPSWTSIPYGRALANQTMHVLDRWRQPCPTWVTGEIHIGGAGVAAGYWRDETRTAERFIRSPRTGARLYRTGDLGRFLPGGDIEILGREDLQVKINGYRVELGEVEACLAALPGVDQVVVSAPPHPGTGQRQVIAHVVLREDGPDEDGPDEAAVRAAAGQQLPSYMVPSRVLPVPAVPLTPNGKVDRAALPVPWGADEPARPEPASPVESALRQIWVAQLGHDEFGTADGFFDAGGDSLHAVGILRELRERLSLSPDLEPDLAEALFTNSDIAGLAEIIERDAA